MSLVVVGKAHWEGQGGTLGTTVRHTIGTTEYSMFYTAKEKAEYVVQHFDSKSLLNIYIQAF